MEIRTRQIVKVCQPWTKGKTIYYYITFANENNEFISGYRLFFASGAENYSSNPELLIPAEYTESDVDGYVNIFTGSKSLRKDQVEIVSEVPTAIHSRLTNAIITMLMGNYTIDAEGKIKLIIKPICIDSQFLVHAMMRGTFSEPEPTTEEVKEEEVKEETTEEVEESIEEETEDDDNDQSEDSTFNKHEYFFNLATSDERLEYVFTIWGIGNKRYIPIHIVYNALFKNSEYNIRANNVLITKEEMMAILHQKYEECSIKFLLKYDGSIYDIDSYDKFNQLKLRIKAIYYNKPKTYYNKKERKLSDEDIVKIKSMIEDGYDKEAIIAEFPIELRRHVSNRIYMTNNEGRDVFVKQRLQKLYNSENKNVHFCAAYLINHFDQIGAIANGATAEYFRGNTDLLQTVAIYVHKSSFYLYRIAMKKFDFIQTEEGKKFFNSICSKSDMFVYPGIRNCSKANDSDYHLYQTVYSYLHNKFSKVKASEFDRADATFCAICNIPMHKFMTAKRYCIENRHSLAHDIKEIAKIIR